MKALLASGVDPTGLYQGEVALPSLQNYAAANATRPPDFYFEPSEMPALRRAISVFIAPVKAPQLCISHPDRDFCRAKDPRVVHLGWPASG